VRPYIHRIQTGEWKTFPASPAADSVQSINRWIEMQETMMVNLRLLEKGVDAEEFENRFGISLQFAFGKQIKSLIDSGLLEWTDARNKALRLSRRGWLLGNRVFREFIGLAEPDWVA
jgi:coproporphyrinogen III oxidase-like Fe-S oxidoreductase